MLPPRPRPYKCTAWLPKSKVSLLRRMGNQHPCHFSFTPMQHAPYVSDINCILEVLVCNKVLDRRGRSPPGPTKPEWLLQVSTVGKASRSMALLQALLLLPLLVAAYAAGADGGGPGILHLPTSTDAGVAAELAYTVYPSNGTLAAGQDLMQVSSGSFEAVLAPPFALSTPLLRCCSSCMGAACMQDERLYSADGSVFLVPQSDGNLVLYNTYAVEHFGGTTVLAALWESGTYNNGGPQPFVLAMQQVLRRSTLVPCTAVVRP